MGISGGAEHSQDPGKPASSASVGRCCTAVAAARPSPAAITHPPRSESLPASCWQRMRFAHGPASATAAAKRVLWWDLRTFLLGNRFAQTVKDQGRGSDGGSQHLPTEWARVWVAWGTAGDHGSPCHDAQHGVARPSSNGASAVALSRSPLADPPFPASLQPLSPTPPQNSPQRRQKGLFGDLPPASPHPTIPQ